MQVGERRVHEFLLVTDSSFTLLPLASLPPRRIIRRMRELRLYALQFKRTLQAGVLSPRDVQGFLAVYAEFLRLNHAVNAAWRETQALDGQQSERPGSVVRYQSGYQVCLMRVHARLPCHQIQAFGPTARTRLGACIMCECAKSHPVAAPKVGVGEAESVAANYPDRVDKESGIVQAPGRPSHAVAYVYPSRHAMAPKVDVGEAESVAANYPDRRTAGMGWILFSPEVIFRVIVAVE
ncbi:hypothetical protein B0H14DRAFT_3451195 [Mycena olivaceomarginata]|nr:hypothetical protein B0H14DRAFT_3451195 [Mycena olivaceomarginata]